MKNIFLLILISTLILSCNQKKTENSSLKTEIEHNNSQKIRKETPKQFYTITNHEGKQICQILWTNNGIEIEYSTIKLIGKLNGDKRKYQNQNNEIATEVKFSDTEKIKIRTPDGKLLWKIKIDSNKIKISDNEEGLNPYQIKRSSADKVKVIDGSDVEIGDGKFEKNTGKVSISSANSSFVINSDKLFSAFGVILCDKISDREKFIIIAELLDKKL